MQGGIRPQKLTWLAGKSPFSIGNTSSIGGLFIVMLVFGGGGYPKTNYPNPFCLISTTSFQEAGDEQKKTDVNKGHALKSILYYFSMQVSVVGWDSGSAKWSSNHSAIEDMCPTITNVQHLIRINYYNKRNTNWSNISQVEHIFPKMGWKKNIIWS